MVSEIKITKLPDLAIDGEVFMIVNKYIFSDNRAGAGM